MVHRFLLDARSVVFQLTCFGWLIFRANSLGQLSQMTGALLHPLQGLDYALASRVFLFALPVIAMPLIVYFANQLAVFRFAWRSSRFGWFVTRLCSTWFCFVAAFPNRSFTSNSDMSILRRILRCTLCVVLFFGAWEMCVRIDQALTYVAPLFGRYDMSTMLTYDDIGVIGRPHGRYLKYKLNKLGYGARSLAPTGSASLPLGRRKHSDYLSRKARSIRANSNES